MKMRKTDDQPNLYNSGHMATTSQIRQSRTSYVHEALSAIAKRGDEP